LFSTAVLEGAVRMKQTLNPNFFVQVLSRLYVTGTCLSHWRLGTYSGTPIQYSSFKVSPNLALHFCDLSIVSS
jgi:hypothetical protein